MGTDLRVGLVETRASGARWADVPRRAHRALVVVRSRRGLHKAPPTPRSEPKGGGPKSSRRGAHGKPSAGRRTNGAGAPSGGPDLGPAELADADAVDAGAVAAAGAALVLHRDVKDEDADAKRRRGAVTVVDTLSVPRSIVVRLKYRVYNISNCIH